MANPRRRLCSVELIRKRRRQQQGTATGVPPSRPILDRTGPKNAWTVEQKIAVALLRRYFDIPWETISVLFNHIYRTHLTQHGFHEYNFPMSRIKTQYYDSIEARQIVYIDNSFDEINNKWDSFRQFIEAVATDLGITIRRREADDCVHEGSYGSKERRKLRLESNTRKAKRKAGVSEGAWQNLDYQHAPQESIQTPPPSGTPASAAYEESHDYATEPSPAALQPSSSSTLAPPSSPPPLPLPLPLPPHPALPRQAPAAPAPEPGPEPELLPIPPVLFRAYSHGQGPGIDSAHVFVAGQFANHIGPIPAALPMHDANFWAQVQNHVNRRPIATPFISLTDSFLWVVRMALNAAGADARIAILDTSMLARALYHVGSVLDGFPLEPRHRRYKGTCEWLLWGSVPANAILATFAVSKLHSVSRTLRLDSFGALSTVKIHRRFVADAQPLGDAEADDIAHLLRYMGLTAFWDPAYLAKPIHEIVQGWSLVGPISPHTVKAFSTCLLKLSKGELTPSERQYGKGNAEAAFIQGAKSAFADLDASSRQLILYKK